MLLIFICLFLLIFLNEFIYFIYFSFIQKKKTMFLLLLLFLHLVLFCFFSEIILYKMCVCVWGVYLCVDFAFIFFSFHFWHNTKDKKNLRNLISVICVFVCILYFYCIVLIFFSLIFSCLIKDVSWEIYKKKLRQKERKTKYINLYHIYSKKN